MFMLFVSMARATRMKIMLILVAMILLSVDGATARGRKTLMDLEIKRQLRRINKPAVKSIKSEDGDVIDCVDIYKQPAFDHPLLKNHTIQMKPSNYDSEKVSSSKPIDQLWHKSGSCPEGTVPIRRTRKSDLLRAISLERNGIKAFTPVMEGNGIKALTPGMESAKLLVDEDIHNINAGEAIINVWNIHVEPEESSYASIFIGKKGKPDLLNSGWIVSHSLFGDNQTRLYGFWAAENAGCFNLNCPGFVQTSKNNALGVVVVPYSTYGGDQYVIEVRIFKDPKLDQWWLEFQNETVGYWPTSLVKNMAEYGDLIEWGGQVYNSFPGGKHTSTQMGSGHFSNEDFKKAAFFDKCTYAGESLIGKPPSLFSPKATNPKCYDISEVSASKGTPGLLFFYGGPGGPDCDT